MGPLHGLPVTFKDQFHVKGLGTTMGYVGWIDTFEGKKNTGKDKKFESEVVRELRSLGAIPIAKVGFMPGRGLTCLATADCVFFRPLWCRVSGYDCTRRVHGARYADNTPTGQAPETNNNILGYTLNPWNQRLSSGGSSGGMNPHRPLQYSRPRVVRLTILGEGALQALRGSAFGVGSDVGGSVSMPAAFQGVFGFKPSSGRIAFKDVASSVHASPYFLPC